MATFLTSDRHFDHFNMTQEGTNLTGRPFKDMDEMREALIEAHNSVVKPHDTVIDLGDMGLSKPEKIFEIYKRLNGNFIIIKGNHDSNKMIKYFEKHNYDYYGRPKFQIEKVGHLMKAQGYVIYCTHYPLDIGERGRVFNIHGHIHEYESPSRFGTNVGVDSPEYRTEVFGQPLEFDRVIEYLKNKTMRE